ncbi:ABC-2 type transport system permease protein [Nocardioides scoriae]|uniref:ABC-2 type transport system permease protein n=1 Tax=Nocardioides scoriae TaxID=642780 RepID=A0A1H1RJ36_9ACTN|nr:ABC transporter permease [Nocardioides scoriae]SDS34969.1 ABC-2 type transport system permease protein [Nocardioides scoriae]
MTASTSPAPSTAPGATTGRRWRGLRRTLLLGRANWTLMVRNRTTMLYAFALPLFPLVLLFTAERTGGDTNAGVASIGTALVMALVFPGYYNLLSMFVTRRDELVLKRLRTGEVRDVELVVSMALPGALVTAAVFVLTVPVAAAAGLDLPLNPLLLLVGLLLSIVTFAAFAVWTAAWTRTAESAQLTSGPVILLALAGFAAPALPQAAQRWAELLPGAAVNELVRVGWFAQDDSGALSFLGTWAASLQPLAVLLAWTALALVLARRSLRWEPRA